MFEYLKDLYYKARGYDLEKIKKERKEKEERERTKRIFFDKKTRYILSFFFLLYLPLCILGIIESANNLYVIGIIKNIATTIFSATSLIAFLIKGKKAELIGIISLVITILLTFLVPTM